MPRRWLRSVVMLAVAAAMTIGATAPARAVDDLIWPSFDYVCSETAGERAVSFATVPDS